MKKVLVVMFCYLVLILSSCRESKSIDDTEFKEGSKISSIALNDQKIEDLKTLGLVWGFLKYYHPNVASGDYNWDFELFRILPKIINAQNKKERDKYLIEWINTLGKFAQNLEQNSKKTEFRIKPDLGWIKDVGLSDDLASILSLLKSAKRTNENYYVSLQKGVGNPVFDNEVAYSEMKYPDAGYRLLTLYRYWNIIQYYFPYKNLIEGDWKNVLEEFIPKFINAENETEYQLAVLELIARIHDTHANLWDKTLSSYWGVNSSAIKLSFIENKAIVTDFFDDKLAKGTGLRIGDEIIKINGELVSDIVVDQLKYTPASNYPTQLRNIAKKLLKTNDTVLKVDYISDGNAKTNIINVYSPDVIDVYKREQDTCFKMINQDVAYLNLGFVKSSYLSNIFKNIKNTKGLIIDLRCYPSDFVVFSLSDYLLPEKAEFVKFTNASNQEPGKFVYTECIEVGRRNKDYYKGKVVILINEITQSQAEYTTMALRTTPNSIVLGSTTAGADGNVSFFYLPGGLRTAISGIGVYYPDNSETQRIGIVPNIVLKPTVEAIKNNVDELLEKAIELIEK